MKNLKYKLINTAKNIGKTYLVIGCLMGIGDLTCNTGHLSSDLYLGYKKPSYVEQKILNSAQEYFNLPQSNWENK